MSESYGRGSVAYADVGDTEIDYFGLKFMDHNLFRGSLWDDFFDSDSNDLIPTHRYR